MGIYQTCRILIVVCRFFGRLPEFESLVETMLENTLLNLLTEANRGEVNLTSRTRVIALPPNRTSKTTR